MPFILRSVLSATLLASSLCAAQAEQLGNASKGQSYARSHCAECHAVEQASDDMSPDFAAPRFVDVANTPGMTTRALAVWLQTSHPTMPNFIIPETERDDVIAYIMSLKVDPPL